MSLQNESIAKQAVEIAKRQSGEWDSFLSQVQKDGHGAEFLEYRQKAGEVMGTLFHEFISPISKRFPSLTLEKLMVEPLKRAEKHG